MRYGTQSYTVGGNGKWCRHFGRIYHFIIIVETLTLGPTTTILVINPMN